MAYIWNPDDYHRHSAAQARWAHELIGKLRLSGSEQVLGLNLFCDMLAFARERFPPEQHPNLRLVEGDMLDLLFEGEFDVAFSNAALHWASVHGRIFSGVARVLRPGGRILFQMGGKGNAAPVVEIADEMLAGEPWNDLLSGLPSRYVFYSPEEERERLTAAGLIVVRAELVGKDMAFDHPDGLVGWIQITWHLYSTASRKAPGQCSSRR